MAHTPAPFQSIPDDIELHRRLMFSLEQPVQFSPAVYEIYFPFIDNVWVFRDAKGRFYPETGLQVLNGACRLCRKPKEDDSSIAPERKRREGTGTCNAKFRMSIWPNGTRVMERAGEVPHNHDLDYIDSIKRSTAIRNMVLHDYFKSWDAAAVLAFLRDPAQRAGGRDLLREAGGHYIYRSEIQNIMTRALRMAHPGQDPSEVRRQLDKYKTYKTCSHKGCTAAPFANSKDLQTHYREVHGLQRHDHTGKICCPDPKCNRRKQSRGFTSVTALEEHQRRHHGIEPDPARRALTQTPVAAELERTGPADSITVGDSDDSDGSNAHTMDASISVPARRHMEERLAQLEKERTRLDAEITALRDKLYGSTEQPSTG